MNTEEKIKNSTTSVFKAIFPNTTNHYDTLFGGKAMALMVETAFITATRFARKKMVTVSSDNIDFSKPIPAGTIVELIGKVITVGNKSIKVTVDVFIEEMYLHQREKAITGNFTLVALNEQEQPVNIL
jgi:acyl-CoA hydrolase